MSKQRQMRYQYYAQDGIKWTRWFDYEGSETKWQLKNLLLNEYRDKPDNPEEEQQ